MAMSNSSAQAIIKGFLDQYGLGGLADWAWNMFTGADGGPGASLEEIRLALPKQKAFLDRFPAYEYLAQTGNAMRPDDYIAYENSVRGFLNEFGVPAGMYDTPAGIAGLLKSRVTADQVRERLAIAADAAFKAPQETRDQLSRLYGINAKDLVGFYLDPEKALPLIQQQYATAQIAGASQAQQIALDKAQAERLASQGVTFEQAQRGFAAVRGQEDLTHALQGGGGVTQDDLIGAQFGDGGATTRVETEARRRSAQYSGGEGGAAAGSTGVSGLRSANR